jgi:hypothetical protein
MAEQLEIDATEDSFFNPEGAIEDEITAKEDPFFKPLPEIPGDLSTLNTEEAEDIIEAYKAQGKEPGIEIAHGFGAEGNQEKFVRHKKFLVEGHVRTKEEHQEVRKRMDALYKKENPDATHVFEQFSEGLLRPTEELILGAMEIASGEKQPETMMSTPQIPYDRLTAAQKFAYVSGAVLGYAAPGGVINSATRGLMKVGVGAVGKEALVREASKSATKYIGNVVAASPTALRVAAGKYAGKFVKNAPSLAAEGAVWGALESRGDLEKTVENAVIFPIMGPALMVGAEAAKGLPSLLKRRDVSKKPRIEQMEDTKVLKAASDPKVNVPETLISDKPSGVSSEVFEKTKKVLSAKLAAETEISRNVKAAKLKKKSDGLEKQLEKASKELTKLQEQKKVVVESIAKGQPVEIIEHLPRSIEELRVSHNTETILKDAFGGIEGIPVEGKVPLLKVLKSVGLNARQASAVNKRLTQPQLKIKKLTPTATIEVGVKDIAGSRQFKSIDARIKQMDELKTSLEAKARVVKSDPLYKEDADLKFLKMGEDELDLLKAQIFLDKTKKMGVETQHFKMPYGSLKGKSLLNYTEKHNIIEAQTGIPMMQVTNDLIEGTYRKSHLLRAFEDFKMDSVLDQLRKIGVDGKKAWEWFHYVHKNKETGAVKWDPRAIEKGSYSLPEFKGVEPSGEVKELLFKLRDMTFEARKYIEQAGQEVGYLPNYVGIKRRVPIGKGLKKRARQRALGKAGLLKERFWGTIPESERHLYHSDLYDLMPRMVSDSINAAAYSGTIDKINSVSWMLRASGRSAMADSFLKYASRAMGHGSKEETIEYIAAHAVDSNPHWANHLASLSGKQEVPVYEDMVRTAYSMMYNSYIGLSSSTMMKQFVQPELVGAAEIGLSNVLYGKGLAYGGRAMKKEAAMAIDRVRSRLYPERINYDMMGEPQRDWLKTFANIMELPGRPGMKVFTELDKKNREVIFLGAKRQFDNAIKKKNKGAQEGSDVYGLIRAKRVNYAYTMAERAEFFSEGAGQYIPFIHWGANQWMRHIENIRGKKFNTLGKRLGFALGGVIAAQHLFNEKFYTTRMQTGAGTLEMSSALPQASMVGVIGSDISPFTLVEGIRSGEVFPAFRAYKKITKKTKKKPTKKELSTVLTWKPKKKRRYR